MQPQLMIRDTQCMLVLMAMCEALQICRLCVLMKITG